MKANPHFIPLTLTLHYWITLVRLLISLAGLIVLVLVIVISYKPARYVAYPIFASLVPINDILMRVNPLTIFMLDFLLAFPLGQTVVSVLMLAPPAILIGLSDFGGVYSLIVLVPGTAHILCTLYLLITLLMCKRDMRGQVSWTSNSKDMLLGCPSNQTQPSWFGHTRNPPLRKRDVSRFSYFWVVYAPKIILRRVSPVESKRYAVFMNGFALLLIAGIIVRAGMALAQAQNQIETRSGVEGCYGIPLVGDVRILVRHKDTLVGINPQTGQGYDVGVQVSTKTMSQYQCTPELMHGMPKSANWFQVFNCGSQNTSYTSFSNAVYTINVRSTNGTSLDAFRLPDVWFANFADTVTDSAADGDPGFLHNVAPWLVPPWQLVGGKHIDASLGMIERRFITSSVFRDSVANLKPTYESASLFTLTTKDSTPLNDNFTASALLTPLLVTNSAFLNDRQGIRSTKDSTTSMPYVCAYIEDYRSSTIFDVIGSIGGLMAILQSVHILLFGRPLLWGITGAKLISPFGLLGCCHSRAFRRRLREQYHRELGGSGDEAAEAMRINAFLRDFVIDFGPADIEQVVVEPGYYAKRGMPHQIDRGTLARDQGHDGANDKFLLLPHSKPDRQSSNGSYITMETMSSSWEP